MNRPASALALVMGALLAACADPTDEPPPDAGAGAAPWSPPEVDPPPGLAVTLEPLLDVNTQAPALEAFGFAGHGGKVYFGARRAGGGFALYATDGAAATEVASRPTWTSAPQALRSVPGALYFTVGDQVLGGELWVTDGTDAGTRVVADVHLGVAPGGAEIVGTSGSIVYWLANTGAGRRLWRTDGTAAGTRQVSDVSINSRPGSAVMLGDKIVLGSAGGPAGAELYLSDGTAAGTRLVADIAPGPASASPMIFAALGATIVFVADDGAHGYELWRTDGTAAGTALVTDLQPGAAMGVNPFATRLYVHQGVAYFSADDGTHGSELWRTDGTAAGTALVADINPGAVGSSPTPSASLGAKLLFTALDATRGREPFVTTGTAASTALLADVAPGIDSSFPNTFAVAGATAYFVANDGAHGNELWRTDGSTAGTALVVDLLPGSGHGASTTGGVAIGDRMYFVGSTPATTRAPYATDGTAAGTVALLANDGGGATAASDPGVVVRAGDKLWFAATDPAHGRELWVRDASGTHLVRDVNPGALAGIGGDPVAFGASVCFRGDDPEHGRELWISDGTEAGTRMIVDLTPGPAGDVTPGIAFDGKLFFFASDGASAAQRLYATDGTAAGTALIAELGPYSPSLMGVYDGMLLFNARDGAQGGVFRYLPTGGTIARISPPGLVAEAITPAAGTIYLSLFAGTNPGIYVTDGTAAGTTRIDPHRATRITALGATLGFITGGEIYRRDGGTSVWVSDAGPPETASITPPVELGAALYYIGGNGASGIGLWRTDLTAGGTQLVRALGPTPSYTAPVRLGDALYFAAGDGATGLELWTSDGTTAGTRLVRDVWPGPRSATPRNLVVHDGALYLSLDDGVHGAEPWRLTAP